MNTDELPSFVVGKDILATQLLELSVMIVQNIRNYANENNLYLPENEALNRLFSEAKRILDDLNCLDNQSALIRLADEKKQLDKNDGEVTVPSNALFKGV